ncbi:MAG: acetyl-CoA carboxylase biotin carboxyl carrier protein [Sphingobacteriia bacterium]
MDIKSIQEILRLVNKSDLTEVEIEDKGFKLVVKRGGQGPVAHVLHSAEMPQLLAAQPVVAPQVAGSSAAAITPAEDAPKAASGGSARAHVIKSPMIGTFYTKPSPDKPTFVKVGDSIGQGQVLCIVEAMKLFNEIESEVSGKIVKILVEDSSPVEYDQPLFEVELA